MAAWAPSTPERIRHELFWVMAHITSRRVTVVEPSSVPVGCALMDIVIFKDEVRAARSVGTERTRGMAAEKLKTGLKNNGATKEEYLASPRDMVAKVDGPSKAERRREGWREARGVTSDCQG
jgi:hypothetical protein